MDSLGYGPGLKLIERSTTTPRTYTEGAENYDGGRISPVVEFDRLRNLMGLPLDQFDLPAWWQAQQQGARRLGGSDGRVSASDTDKWRGIGVQNGKLVEVASTETERAYLRRLGFVSATGTTAGTGLQTDTVFGQSPDERKDAPVRVRRRNPHRPRHQAD